MNGRFSELLKLDWSRVDLKAVLIYLEGVHTKSGRRRSVPINAIARSAITNRMRFRAEHYPGSTWVFCDKRGRRIAIFNSRRCTPFPRATVTGRETKYT